MNNKYIHKRVYKQIKKNIKGKIELNLKKKSIKIKTENIYKNFYKFYIFYLNIINMHNSLKKSLRSSNKPKIYIYKQ